MYPTGNGVVGAEINRKYVVASGCVETYETNGNINSFQSFEQSTDEKWKKKKANKEGEEKNSHPDATRIIAFHLAGRFKRDAEVRGSIGFPTLNPCHDAIENGRDSATDFNEATTGFLPWASRFADPP